MVCKVSTRRLAIVRLMTPLGGVERPRRMMGFAQLIAMALDTGRCRQLPLQRAEPSGLLEDERMLLALS